MKKVSFLFAALFVCALAISSCQSKPSGEGSDSTKTEETVAPADTTAASADTTATPAQ